MHEALSFDAVPLRDANFPRQLLRLTSVSEAGEHRDGSLFLDDHGALFGLCDRVGCGLGLLPAAVVFGLAFAVIDVPHVVFFIDADR